MKAPHNYTATSIAAARSVEASLAKREAEVYAVFVLTPAGCTTEEVELALKQKHQSVSARINALFNRGALIKTGEVRKNTSGRPAYVYAIPGLSGSPKSAPETVPDKKEISMAGKKKSGTKNADRSWHKKVMGVFAAQEDKSAGFNYSEIRQAMELGEEDEGFEKIPEVMMDLRNASFLAHKFTPEALKNDFFMGGSPADVANIVKRSDEEGQIQVIFYLSPGAASLGDDLDAAVESGELPNAKLPDGIFIFTRETMLGWVDKMGEIIDLHVNDPAFQMESAKMLVAMSPPAKK